MSGSVTEDASLVAHGQRRVTDPDIGSAEVSRLRRLTVNTVPLISIRRASGRIHLITT